MRGGDPVMAYRGEVFVNFQTTRQWVSIKLFALPPDADDRAVLASLLRHARYRDSYAGTGDKDMETIHGPYRLSAITVDSFVPISADGLASHDGVPGDAGPNLLDRYLGDQLRVIAQ